MNAWNVLLLVFAALSLVEGMAIVGLLREVGGIYMQVGQPRPGQTPDQGPSVGDQVEDGLLALSRSTILFFLSPTCSLCPPVAKAIPVAARNYRELEFLAAVVGPTTEEKLRYAAGLGPNARTDLDDLFQRWEVAGTPFAVGLTADGTVRSVGIVNSLPQIESMAQTLVGVQREIELHSADQVTVREAL